MRLPPDLITRLKPLLLPYVRDKDEREALLIETFFLRDPRPLDLISFEGNADVFATRCIADLVRKIGCVAQEGERQHTLSALLLTIRARCGVEKYAEIDAWLPILDDECAAPTVETPPTPRVTTLPQTINTPLNQRSASVFISYSHNDEAFAQRLIGDLNAAGHACWIDTSKIKGGADWQRAICEGINNSYALVVVCTRKALESEYVWDEIQWARTRRKLIIPALLEDVTDDDRFFGLHRYQGIRFDRLAHLQAVAALLAALPTAPPLDATAVRRRTQREYELAYLDQLRFDDFRLEKFELAEYAALGGVAHTRREVRDGWETLAMRQEFALIRGRRHDAPEMDVPAEAFTDAVSKIGELRRVVVLGEPGAGKTHTLRAIAKPLYTAALTDPSAPLPLLVKLGNWDKPDQPFETFLREALGELGAYLDELLGAKRAVLLLDGLNEFPADQRMAKYPQVEAFIKAHPDLTAVVTCREADYTLELHMNQVVIRPLDPPRILDFAHRALRLKAENEGNVFFWKLAGGEAVKAVWHKWEAAGATFPQFWSVPDIPRENPDVYSSTNGDEDQIWREHVRSSQSLMRLASNPYMLRMLLDVYIQFKGALPSNRGQLFAQFVNYLLGREKLATIEGENNDATLTAEAEALLRGLQRIAFEMQVRRAGVNDEGETSAGTALDLVIARAILNERLLYLAVSTSILNSGEQVRFSHQLLQEYFAARYMDEEFRAGRLKASDIWRPEQWWERTNWEEAAILLAGLYSDDCTPVLNWLADINPEVAALCIVRSGATTPDATKIRLRDRWLPRLTSLQTDPQPNARAAVGRALGLFRIGDQIADNRPGVGLGTDGLPHIIWRAVYDDREWIYQNKPHPPLAPYAIAKYPITYMQFQAFVDAEDGWRKGDWWEGLSLPEGHNSAPVEQWFKYWNHPRERVSWYDAIAFCRWLSFRLGSGYALDRVREWAVRLPTELEWELAARGTDGRVYPYGNDFDPVKGNTQETGIRQTSAVGIFSEGVSPVGAVDMSGNVWEWCLNKYDAPDDTLLDGKAMRVLRGGSWSDAPDGARAVYRSRLNPRTRDDYYGFRVVREGVPSP